MCACTVFNCWEEITGGLIICKMTPDLGQMFRTAPYHGVLYSNLVSVMLSKATYFAENNLRK